MSLSVSKFTSLRQASLLEQAKYAISATNERQKINATKRAQGYETITTQPTKAKERKRRRIRVSTKKLRLKIISK
jgi:hypothetical protein